MNVGILRAILELRDKFAPALAKAQAEMARSTRRKAALIACSVLALVLAGVIAASWSKRITTT